MEFRLLGPLEVIAEQGPVPLGPPQQRALLTVLLLNVNEAVSRDRLIDELWPEKPPATAPKLVQVYVSALRKLLEPAAGETGEHRVLVTSPPGYMLRVGPDQLDLMQFERMRREARDAVRSADPAAARARLEKALSLWRGQPLADFAYEPFAQTEIARLEELRLAALEERIEADLALGRHGDLVGELETLVSEHPLRERFLAQLMLALYRSGRQVEALEAYRHAREALTEELGIEPGRELRQLEQSILQQDRSLDFVRAEDGAVVDGPSLGLFVGREAELEELLQGLEDAFAGHGSLYLVVGEPGIGKSRLAEELIAQAQARGAKVLVGRAWEAGGAPTYWPWVQALRTHVEDVAPDTLREQLGGGAPDVAQILPELRDLLPDLSPPPRETEGARLRLFDATTRFLRQAAAAHPLLVMLDDLHAADEASLLLLRFLVGELGSTRILLLGTYRDVDPTVRDPLASTLAELARERVTRRIELMGLTESDLGRYVELSTGTSPPRELVTALHRETEGNPLFVGEVVRLLAAEGRLAEGDVGSLATLGIPQGVREVIGRRIGRLSEGCRDVATLAAVLGREFRLDALKRLSAVDDDELLNVLDEGVGQRLLASVPGSPGRLRFAHALIRETLYEGLTTPRRVQLHRRAGETLESLYGEQVEPHLTELAHHFFEAAPGGDVGKALSYTRRAAERALAQLAYEEAARLYDLALQVLELQAAGDSETRAELLLALGEALARAGRTPEAKKTFLGVAELSRGAHLHEHLARAALGYGGRFPFARAGTDDRLVPLLEEALERLGGEPTVLRVRVLARLAGALRDELSLQHRSALAREAVDLARELGDQDALAYALVSMAAATWSPDAAAVKAIGEDIIRLADEIGDAERTFQGIWITHIGCFILGETDRAADMVAQHRAYADMLKQPSLQWYNLVLRAVWALFRGDFAEAEQLIEEGWRVGQLVQPWDAGFSYRIAMFVLRREQGRLEEIDPLIRQSVAEYASYRSFRCLVPLIDCELGHEHEARIAFDELAADDFGAFPRDGEWVFCLTVLTEVATHLEDRERAAILYDLLAPHAQINVTAAGEVGLGAVSRYLGLLATANRSWDDAERHFEDAIEMNMRMVARPWVAHAQHDYARMLLARDAPGDRDRAGRLLSSALATYDELAMPAPAARAAALGNAVAPDVHS